MSFNIDFYQVLFVMPEIFASTPFTHNYFLSCKLAKTTLCERSDIHDFNGTVEALLGQLTAILLKQSHDVSWAARMKN